MGGHDQHDSTGPRRSGIEQWIPEALSEEDIRVRIAVLLAVGFPMKFDDAMGSQIGAEKASGLQSILARRYEEAALLAYQSLLLGMSVEMKNFLDEKEGDPEEVAEYQRVLGRHMSESFLLSDRVERLAYLIAMVVANDPVDHAISLAQAAGEIRPGDPVDRFYEATPVELPGDVERRTVAAARAALDAYYDPTLVLPDREDDRG